MSGEVCIALIRNTVREVSHVRGVVRREDPEEPLPHCHEVIVVAYVGTKRLTLMATAGAASGVTEASAPSVSIAA